MTHEDSPTVARLQPTRLVPLLLVLLLAGACSGGAASTAPARLEVDAEQWPVKVLELGQASIALMKQTAPT